MGATNVAQGRQRKKGYITSLEKVVYISSKPLKT
jgi:hypothetical protein